MHTDDELVETHLAGDQKAFAVLVLRYMKPVYGTVLRIVATAHDAEDATQETFVKAWRNISSYRNGASFRAWILKIARNTAIDLMRKRREPTFTELESAEDDDASHIVADASPSQYETAALAQEGAEVNRFLRKLPLEDQEILLLHYREDLTFREIGDILDKPLNTVKSQNRRALQTLKQLMNAPR